MRDAEQNKLDVIKDNEKWIKRCGEVN